MVNTTDSSVSEKVAVSVIVPNYNYSSYLDDRIKSILSQTFKDYELILLDDASSDNSVEIINKYKTNPHVTAIVVNKENSGSPFSQWKKGIDMAKGKWIWIAEADDLADPEFLETCHRYAESVKDVSICYADSNNIDSDGNLIISKRRKPRFDNAEAVSFDGRTFARSWMVWENPVVNASAVVFRKDFALSITDKQWMRLRYTGDWMFWFEMAKKGKVIKIQRFLNYFRHHVSQTQNGIVNGISYAECYTTIHKIVDSFPEFSAFEKTLIRGKLVRRIGHIKNEKTRTFVRNSYESTFGKYSMRDKWMFKVTKFLHFIPVIPSEKKYKKKDGCRPVKVK